MKHGRLWLWLTVGGFVVVIGVSAALGARINTTKSFPLGLYWTAEGAPSKGALVIFCPPPTRVFSEAKERGYIGAGFCPGGYGYMIKKVLAAKGDRVAITEKGVAVNGDLIANTQLYVADKSGRPMLHYQSNHYTVEASEVLLLSDHSPTSFDGRYFGPIQQTQIRSVIRPIFTW